MAAERLTVLCWACFCRACLCWACAVAIAWAIAVGQPVFAADETQYAFDDIRIPKAWAGEPIREPFSLSQAANYLDQGAKAWSGARKCNSCHTTGTYMLVRPALTRQLGPPHREMRDHFVAAFRDLGRHRSATICTSRPGPAR